MSNFKVFISHSNKENDNQLVNRIASGLRSTGIRPYIAEKDRQPGCYICQKIQDNIEDSDVAIGIWTKNSKDSDYVKYEMGYADGCIPCFLLVEKGVRVFDPFQGREYIEFNPNDPTSGLSGVMETLKEMKKKKESDAFWGKVGIVAGVIAGAAAVYGAHKYLSSKKK